jgi:isopentenyl diphosphate isomerase/L-lactate dehydrogenase-like FMN-dependent dehydrogenase
MNITLSFKDRWHKEKTRRAARKAARQRNTQVIGLGWYSREQWEALTKVVPDRSELDDTYEAWEAQATDALQTLAAQGARPVKVQVDVQELVAWCRSKDRPVNGESRADFVGHLLAKHS